MECKTFHRMSIFVCVQNNIKIKVHYLSNSEECHDFQDILSQRMELPPSETHGEKKEINNF